jgi:hypothetical protein
MTRLQALTVSVLATFVATASPCRAAAPPLRIAYLSGNAGEIDPCG